MSSSVNWMSRVSPDTGHWCQLKYFQYDVTRVAQVAASPLVGHVGREGCECDTWSVKSAPGLNPLPFHYCIPPATLI